MFDKPKPEPRWYINDIKKEFKALPDGKYELIEYAYMLCVSDGEPRVRKVRVENE